MASASWDNVLHVAKVKSKDVAGPARNVLFLHGLMGQGKNWASTARQFSKVTEGRWQGYTVDLRGHGGSRHIGSGAEANRNSVWGARNDLLKLIAGICGEGANPRALEAAGLAEPLESVDAVVAHSFGGKVALSLADTLGRETGPNDGLPYHDFEAARRALDMDSRRAGSAEALRVVVVDSIPGPVESSWIQDVADILDFAEGLDLSTVSDRRQVRQLFLDASFSRMLAEWMTTNTTKAATGATELSFDPTTIRQLLESYKATDLWGPLEAPPDGLRVGLIVGTKGLRWHADDQKPRLDALAERMQQWRQRLAAGTLRPGEGTACLELLRTGHWVHVEDPRGMQSALRELVDA